MRPGPAPRVAGGLLMVTLAAGGSAHADAQEDVVRLATACAVGDDALEAPCLETALAVQAAQALIGLAASGGAELPGSSSTLGKRFDGRPRLGISVQGGFVDASVPDALGPPVGTAPEAGAFTPSVQATLGVGLFQGFSTAPTVGGILSLDLLGTFSYVDLPGDRGFRDSPTGLGLGARVGLFRESFTLPGITVSATRRWMGRTRLSEDGGDATRADLDVTVTSLRGTVGKTLAGLDVLAGVGWDRYGSEVDMVVRPGGSDGGPEGRTEADDFSSERILVYGGAGYTFLVYQLSAEVGYARGLDDIPGRAGGGFDPTSGSPFLRLAFRFTY